jgi:predicted nucleic acid-binding protein
MGLIADLGTGRIGVDTCLFIYFIEEDRRFLPLIEPLFADVAAGKRQIVTSALTLLEVLVVPYRARNAQIAERYEELLTRSRGISMIELSRDQLRFAAQLRAVHGVKTPDSLQLAAAISRGCIAFVTNDRRLPPIGTMRTLQLRDYVTSAN